MPLRADVLSTERASPVSARPLRSQPTAETSHED
jgi:hypothetical protein